MSATSRPDGSCEQVRPMLAELALGILEARRRGEVLSHLECCGACSLEADRLARTADLLSELAPLRSPQRSLARAVLAQGAGRHPVRQGQARRLVAVGALALLVALAALMGLLVPRGQRSSSRRSLTPVATKAPPGRHTDAMVVLASVLRGTDGTALGMVQLHSGRPARLSVRLSAVWSHRVRCIVRTWDGRAVDLGSYPASSWGWVALLPMAASAVRDAELVGPSGAVLARASFSSP
jgi:hypothetical protein